MYIFKKKIRLVSVIPCKWHTYYDKMVEEEHGTKLSLEDTCTYQYHNIIEFSANDKQCYQEP